MSKDFSEGYLQGGKRILKKQFEWSYILLETWGSEKSWRRSEWERGWERNWGGWGIWILLWQKVTQKLYFVFCAKTD